MLRLLGSRFAGWLAVGLVLLATPWAAAEEPLGTFEVVLLTLKKDWQAVRYHAQTGETWYAFQGDWKPVPEPATDKPPAGDYRIFLSETGDNDWIALRLDRKSGRSWRLAALKWIEMKVLEADKPKPEGLRL